jgi:opacity protein-like surface antigen
VLRRIAILVGVLVLGGGEAAQSQRPLSLSLAGGASLPQGRLGDAVGTGWHALASVGLSTLMQPIGLRLDAAYSRFPLERTTVSGDQTVSSATLNLSYRLPMTNSPISPYVIAGAGAYRLDCSGSVACSAATRFGWNAGLGMKFAALAIKGFLESRFHAVTAGSVRYIPLTIGITF